MLIEVQVWKLYLPTPVSPSRERGLLVELQVFW